jgi:hypothetical protein
VGGCLYGVVLSYWHPHWPFKVKIPAGRYLEDPDGRETGSRPCLIHADGRITFE